MAKYLKLGVNARNGGSFTDSSTEINIANDQVVKVKEKHLAYKHIQERLQGGHIVPATEQEYNDYLAKVAKLEDNASEKIEQKKLATKQAEETDEDEEDTENDSDEDDYDEDDDDEDEEEARTHASMLADLKASPLVDEKEKAKLDKMKLAKIIALHNKVILQK